MWGTENTRGMGEVTVTSMAETMQGRKSRKQVKQHGALLDEPEGNPGQMAEKG